jgi:hypothetical protein
MDAHPPDWPPIICESGAAAGIVTRWHGGSSREKPRTLRLLAVAFGMSYAARVMARSGISFRVSLGNDDWDSARRGWRCSALRISGVAVTKLCQAGSQLGFEVDQDEQLILYLGPDPIPSSVAAVMQLKRHLVLLSSLLSSTALATVVAAGITTAGSYYAAVQPARQEVAALRAKAAENPNVPCTGCPKPVATDPQPKLEEIGEYKKFCSRDDTGAIVLSVLSREASTVGGAYAGCCIPVSPPKDKQVAWVGVTSALAEDSVHVKLEHITSQYDVSMLHDDRLSAGQTHVEGRVKDSVLKAGIEKFCIVAKGPAPATVNTIKASVPLFR